MAKRKAKNLTSWGRGENPSIFVVVQAAVKTEYGGDADIWGHSAVDCWHAAAMMDGDLDYNDAFLQFGKDAREFWSWLETITAKSGGKVCLVSLSARETIAILGLWDKILDDTARLSGLDPRYTPDADDHKAVKKQGFAILEGPPTIVKFQTDARPLEFVWVDPANYGAGDLSTQLGRGINEPNLHSWNGPPWLVGDRLDKQVLAVWTWLASYFEMLKVMDLGGFENTAASQAMAGYRRSYMEYPIQVHDNAAVLEFERQALHGGRNECRKIGEVKGPIYHLDVNSLYPAMAGNMMLPSKLECVVRWPELLNVTAAAATIPIIARVQIRSKVPTVPVRCPTAEVDDTGPFPVNPTRENESWPGITIYPAGVYWATLCGPEILLAAKHGRLLRCSVLAAYEGRPLYRKWVDTLYAFRMKCRNKGDHVMSGCVKAILNSSFGKWAQRLKVWEDRPKEMCPWPFYQWFDGQDAFDSPISWRCFCHAVQEQVDGGEPKESFPAITAMIQSAARVRLWELMETARQENVFYYDTDSLWVNEAGHFLLERSREVDPSELGKLKQVGCHHTVHFYGQKRYVADGIVTMSGVNAPTGKLNDAFALQLKAPPTSHYLFKKEPPGFELHSSKVRLNIPYRHGHVQADGSVTPVELHDTRDERFRFGS